MFNTAITRLYNVTEDNSQHYYTVRDRIFNKDVPVSQWQTISQIQRTMMLKDHRVKKDVCEYPNCDKLRLHPSIITSNRWSKHIMSHEKYCHEHVNIRLNIPSVTHVRIRTCDNDQLLNMTKNTWSNISPYIIDSTNIEHVLSQDMYMALKQHLKK
jgi:hypothetical protein